MVSNASEDLPEPDSPVITTRLSRGRSTSMFLRLCSRAPRIRINCCMQMNLARLVRSRHRGGATFIPVAGLGPATHALAPRCGTYLGVSRHYSQDLQGGNPWRRAAGFTS